MIPRALLFIFIRHISGGGVKNFEDFFNGNDDFLEGIAANASCQTPSRRLTVLSITFFQPKFFLRIKNILLGLDTHCGLRYVMPDAGDLACAWSKSS